GWRRGPQGGNSSSPRRPDGTHLVASELEDSGGGTDEDDARLSAGAGHAGIFAQESIAGIDRIGIGLLRSPDDLGDIQVCAHRMAALANHVRLIGFDPVTT